MQPVPVTLQVMVGQGRVVPEPSQSLNVGAFRFATTDGKRFVQISPANFIYQTNDPYSGWHDFRQKLIDLWNSSSDEINVRAVTKLGLRYINRFVKSAAQPRIRDWLQPTADLPASLISAEDHFFARIETSPAPLHVRLVTAAAEAPGPDWPMGSIILDIDRATTEPCETDDAILKRLEHLHEDIWIAFDSAATAHLKNHLNGKLK
jgi:uncharacterized protein (TIGR04255 family)